MNNFKMKMINETLSKDEKYSSAKMVSYKKRSIDGVNMNEVVYTIAWDEQSFYLFDVVYKEEEKEVAELAIEAKKQIAYFKYLSISSYSKSHTDFISSALFFREMHIAQNDKISEEKRDNYVDKKAQEMIASASYKNNFPKIYKYFIEEGYLKMNEALGNKEEVA